MGHYHAQARSTCLTRSRWVRAAGVSVAEERCHARVGGFESQQPCLMLHVLLMQCWLLCGLGVADHANCMSPMSMLA